MNISILSCAEQELSDAVDYYNKFAAEVKSTLTRIISFPEAWPHLSQRLRRCMTNRFPYGVVYQIRADHILVTAIMYLKRDPQKWQDRT